VLTTGSYVRANKLKFFLTYSRTSYHCLLLANLWIAFSANGWSRLQLPCCNFPFVTVIISICRFKKEYQVKGSVKDHYVYNFRKTYFTTSIFKSNFNLYCRNCGTKRVKRSLPAIARHIAKFTDCGIILVKFNKLPAFRKRTKELELAA
jgi:hypothetical protein